jgi:hypothetical protein
MLCNIYTYNVYQYDLFPLFHFHIYIYSNTLKYSVSMKVLHTVVFLFYVCPFTFIQVQIGLFYLAHSEYNDELKNRHLGVA